MVRRGQPLFMDAPRYVLEANHVFYFMNRNAFSTMWTCHQEVGRPCNSLFCSFLYNRLFWSCYLAR